MVVESREKIEQQNQQLSDYEAEINLLRRRLETLETDREKDKKQIATLQDALNRARIVSILSSFFIFIYLFNFCTIWSKGPEGRRPTHIRNSLE